MSRELTRVLVTDCGSTTTKAILFEKIDGAWHSTVRGEAPTTVEKPLADVTIGARNSFQEVEELWGKKFLNSSEGNPLMVRESDSSEGIDIYLSTSSAGGGLQMVVLGVVGSLTARAAERAALGGGAIVMDTISIDDGRDIAEKIQRIRHLKPDIVLIAGGTEGGTVAHPIELAELLLQADPRPRFGDTLKVPVIYAGNSSAAPDIKKILSEKFALTFVENLKPTIKAETLAPARDAIHEIFLSHVMSHAPGYSKLLTWSPKDIIPTPVAFAQMVSTISEHLNSSVLAVDIGGATTDVFSSLRNPDGSFLLNRTVSANLGMSYSVANVLTEAGLPNIERWVPFKTDRLEDILRNKMIRPTSVPQTKEELLIEQAVAREALRLSLEHHSKLVLSEDSSGTGIEGVFQKKITSSLDRLRSVDLIIGSGGVLSHAPDRRIAALMLLDAFQPLGVSKLAVDSVFMLPHLGVLSTLNPQAATEILMRDCLISLGTSISVSGISNKQRAQNKLLATGKLGEKTFEVRAGDFLVFELPEDRDEELIIQTKESEINFGAGAGKVLSKRVFGGALGVVIDARGRPIIDGDISKILKQLGVI